MIARLVFFSTKFSFHFPTFLRIVKFKISRKDMVLHPRFQRARDQILETLHRTSRLLVIRAALELGVNVSCERYDELCGLTVISWRFASLSN